MYSVKNQNLWEAYQSIYEPQELTEEVQIAAEYFYEMGLNEEGVEILIEELGEEEFINWIYDIMDEYVLSEASQTRLQKMAAKKNKIVVGPKGSRPQSTTKSAIQKMGGTKKRISSSQRPDSTISGKRKKAASKAAIQQTPSSAQPEQTKKGIGGIIQNLGKSWQTAREVGRGYEKRVAGAAGALVGATVGAAKFAHKAGQEFAKSETGKRIKQDIAKTKTGEAAVSAASAGREAHKEGKTGAQIAGRVAGTFVRNLTREEVESWVNALVEEGYDLSEYTWDDMAEMYMNEMVNPPTRQELARVAAMSTVAGRNASGIYNRGQVEVKAPRGGKPGTVLKQNGVVDPKSWRPTYNKPTPIGRGMSAYNPSESFDLFDTILEYLVAEGYTDTNENALVIMANMSEEWRQSIVEEVLDEAVLGTRNG